MKPGVIKRGFCQCFCSLLLLVCMQSAQADMAELEQHLSAFDSYRATFEQKTYDNDDVLVQSMTGKIVLQRPDHFFWQSDDPYAQKLISNGKLIWHYDVDLEQVVVQEYAEQLDKAPMLVILRQPEKLAQRYQLAETTKEDGSETFVLKAKEKQAALSAIHMVFKKNKLARLQFVDQLRQRTDVSFNKVEINPEIDPKLFEFEVPEGADVLYE